MEIEWCLWENRLRLCGIAENICSPVDLPQVIIQVNDKNIRRDILSLVRRNLELS